MKIFSLLLSLVTLAGTTAFASVWRVNNQPNTSANFSSINQAVTSANVHTGDTLYIEGSTTTYGWQPTGNSNFLSKSLIFIGPGYFLDRVANSCVRPLSAKVFNLNFEAGSAGSVLIGLEFDSAAGGTTNFRTNNITIERCKVTSLASDKDAYNIIVQQCYFTRRQNANDPGFFINDRGGINFTNIIFRNNIFHSRVDIGTFMFEDFSNNAIDVAGTGNVLKIKANTVQNNILRGQGTVDVQATQSQNNWAENGQFGGANGNVDYDSTDTPFGPFDTYLSFDERYRLRAGSAANTGGVGGIAVGPYGGTFFYRTGGLANIPVVYGLRTNGVGSVGGTIQVNVKARIQD